MPDRARTVYTEEWVQAVLRPDAVIHGRDASSVRALAQGFKDRPGLAGRIAWNMNAWRSSPETGDPDRIDYWQDWKDSMATRLREEGDDA